MFPTGAAHQVRTEFVSDGGMKQHSTWAFVFLVSSRHGAYCDRILLGQGDDSCAALLLLLLLLQHITVVTPRESDRPLEHDMTFPCPSLAETSPAGFAVCTSGPSDLAV